MATSRVSSSRLTSPGEIARTSSTVEIDGGRNRLELMRELEASLGRGSRALVALDLAGLERETGEQRAMAKALAGYAAAGTDPGHECAGWAPEVRKEADRRESAVLQALRLHGALLRRAQHKLRVMANTLADPGVNYRAPQWPFRGDCVESCRV